MCSILNLTTLSLEHDFSSSQKKLWLGYGSVDRVLPSINKALDSIPSIAQTECGSLDL